MGRSYNVSPMGRLIIEMMFLLMITTILATTSGEFGTISHSEESKQEKLGHMKNEIISEQDYGIWDPPPQFNPGTPGLIPHSDGTHGSAPKQIPTKSPSTNMKG
ncbi:hypothetical protein LIER_35608 [Lithospermum erythrorhizon]|uniref:Uncharacterized protein n=1 Tax=Lithospermum erythrorhizon TaxID=34254 RepID=A0AAV3NV02_LITER